MATAYKREKVWLGPSREFFLTQGLVKALSRLTSVRLVTSELNSVILFVGFMVSPLIDLLPNMCSVYYIQVLEAEGRWYFPKLFRGTHNSFERGLS